MHVRQNGTSGGIRENQCVHCGLNVEGKATTHHECLGTPYIGYGI